jgi:hypothetical protein
VLLLLAGAFFVALPLPLTLLVAKPNARAVEAH